MGKDVNLGGGFMKDVFMGPTRFSNVTMTLSANLTLTADSPTLLFIDPNGGRDLTLPAEANSDGLMFIIINRAGGAEILDIKDDSPATIVTPTQNEVALVFCDGTTWEGFVASNP